MEKNARFRKLQIPLRRGVTIAFVFFVIEFLDEFIYAATGAVMPSLRSEFSLTYPQIGLLLGLPQVINTILDPALMLLGDTRFRKLLIVCGGFAFGLTTILFGAAWAFPVLLAAQLVSSPANSAFVSLSQAALMDQNNGRQAQMMARWNAAGSAGNLVGPLLLAGGFALGFGWRWLYLGFGAVSIALALVALRKPFPARPVTHPDLTAELKEVARGAWSALRNLRLLRWIALEQTADLMLDIFTSFLALYFTEAAGFTSVQAGLLLSAYILVSLVADLLLIPLLEKLPGARLIRITSLAMLAVYPLWLLVPWQAAKVALLLVLPFCRLGWYPVISGFAYAELPGRAAIAHAVGSLGGLLNAGLVALVSLTAGRFGLQSAMWLLLLAPVSILLLVKTGGRKQDTEHKKQASGYKHLG